LPDQPDLTLDIPHAAEPGEFAVGLGGIASPGAGISILFSRGYDVRE